MNDLRCTVSLPKPQPSAHGLPARFPVTLPRASPYASLALLPLEPHSRYESIGLWSWWWRLGLGGQWYRLGTYEPARSNSDRNLAPLRSTASFASATVSAGPGTSLKLTFTDLELAETTKPLSAKCEGTYIRGGDIWIWEVILISYSFSCCFNSSCVF